MNPGEPARKVANWWARGYAFGPLRRGSDRAGAILATGESRDEALANADEAASRIVFRVH